MGVPPRIAPDDYPGDHTLSDGLASPNGVVLDIRCRCGSGWTASLCPGCNPTADEVHLTDRGNAQRVVDRFGADLRYCAPMKKFLHYGEGRWRFDDTNTAAWLVKDTQRQLYGQVATEIAKLGAVGNDEDRKAQLSRLNKLLAHLLRWEDQKKLTACLDSIKSEPGVPILPAQLDADPWLLNCINCTLDLRSGQPRGHRREDYHTKRSPVIFDQAADCQLWLNCLKTWMAGNTNLIGYLQRVVGYWLTGAVGEQCLWFFHGGGQNGKTVFLRTVQQMLGDYALTGVDDLLMQKRHQSHPTERAAMFGKRLVLTTEQDQGVKMAEAMMKRLTGEEVVTARRMKEDFWEFEPTHKLVLAANHRPEVRGQDLAVWRRIKLVPWNVTIPENEKDKNLLAKLKAEWPGILAWAVRGCLDWQRFGMEEPDEVRDATEAYREEQNIIAAFVAERCTVNPQLSVRSGILLAAFVAWHGQEVTRNAFASLMSANGYHTEDDRKKCKVYKGIGLNHESDAGDCGDLAG